MKTFKTLGVVAVVGLVLAFGSDIGELISLPGARHLLPSAEAIVGRPLTPVSVAGVARRTVRRCAVGVYHCNLLFSPAMDGLLGETVPEPIRPENMRSGAAPAAG